MIAVVDAGIGNLGSIVNMLRRVDVASTVTSDPHALASAEKLILPGVGAFDRGMEALDRHGLLPVLEECVVGRGTPVLGICLGMQLLARGSEEGEHPGLGWIAADVVRFRFDEPDPMLRVPHMGWSEVTATRASPLLAAAEPSRFYFVHSYHLRCDDADAVLATAHHGHPFPAVVGSGAVFGVQFHPEKSHRFGMALLRRFADVESTRAA